MCGVCGDRMTVRYHSRESQQVPVYVCQRERIEHAGRICQHIPGAAIDEAIGTLLLETLTPMALEVALQVQDELHKRIEEVDRLHRQRVDRVQYEAELARRRFMQVDPDNRLVADALEADWNEKLRAHNKAHEQYVKQRETAGTGLTDKQRAQIAALATDFPAIWRNPRDAAARAEAHGATTYRGCYPHQARCTLVHVRFKGGAIPDAVVAFATISLAETTNPETNRLEDRPTARLPYG